MVELNLHALYSGLTVGHTPIVLCMCQQQSGIRASYHSRWVLFFVLLLYYCMITYACCHVCMYVITFSNRNIFHGFTLVTNFFSITCHVENKGRSLVRYINSKINERAQCVCVGGVCGVWVCVCVVWCVWVCEWVKEKEERGWRTKVREEFFLVEFWYALAPVSSCSLLVTPTVDHTGFHISLVGLTRSNSLFLFASRLICSS